MNLSHPRSRSGYAAGETGVITGYRAEVDPAEVGPPLTAFLQLRCETGHCLLKNTSADDFRRSWRYTS